MLKTQTVQLIWEKDFSELVAKTYGRPYRYQQQNLDGQETIFKFSVLKEYDDSSVSVASDEITTWLNDPREFKYDFEYERESYPDFYLLLIDLKQRGLIEPGDYALHIWW